MSQFASGARQIAAATAAVRAIPRRTLLRRVGRSVCMGSAWSGYRPSEASPKAFAGSQVLPATGSGLRRSQPKLEGRGWPGTRQPCVDQLAKTLHSGPKTADLALKSAKGSTPGALHAQTADP